jgi:hypothetical protein
MAGDEGVRTRARRWWADGPLRRPGARRRYLVVIVVIGLLAGLPAIVASWPVSTGTASASTLLTRIRASDTIAYSGLASSSGQLALPNLGIGPDVTALLSSTNRLRVWWVGPDRYRVDRETAGGESDVYRNGDTTLTWDSERSIAVQSRGTPQIPLPGPQDALPGSLTRRLLAQAKPEDVTVGGARRIARQPARELIWHPHDKRSLIGEVRAWVDVDTGFPYGVEIRAVGGKARAFSSSFLDVSLQRPDPAPLQVDPCQDPTAICQPPSGDGFDSNTSPVALAKTIGGLVQRSPMDPLVATYGEGASVVAVSAFDPESARNLRASIDAPGRPPIHGKFGEGSLIETPLVTGLIFSTDTEGYLLLGTVTRAQLEAMALDLVRHPPRVSLSAQITSNGGHA